MYFAEIDLVRRNMWEEKGFSPSRRMLSDIAMAFEGVHALVRTFKSEELLVPLCDDARNKKRIAILGKRTEATQAATGLRVIRSCTALYLVSTWVGSARVTYLSW